MRKMKKYLLIILCDISLVYGVPPDYCNRPLNTSDCKGKPTRVFAYYKPGSRCEIETWRGCPSYNKFPSEIACVDLCIFRFNGKRAEAPRVEDETEEIKSDYDDIIDDDSSENNIPKLCQGKLNTTKCQMTPKTVFTYDIEEEQCVQANWYMCPTKNMFNTRQQCAKTCEDQNDGLVKLLKQKTSRDFALIDKLLNDIVDNIAVVNESEQVDDNQKLHNEVIVTEADEPTLETVATTMNTVTQKSSENDKTEHVTREITTTVKPTETTEYNNEIDQSDEVKSTTIKKTQATTEATTLTEASIKTAKVTETKKILITEITKVGTSKATEIASTAPTETQTSKVTVTVKPKTSKVTVTVKPETSKVTETFKPETKPTIEVTSKATNPTSKTSTVKIKPTEVLILSDDENGMAV